MNRSEYFLKVLLTRVSLVTCRAFSISEMTADWHTGMTYIPVS